MTTQYYFYEPGKGHGLAHDPFNAIVAPRPIGWVASSDHRGQINLAPYSFFNAFNYRPPIIGFSSIGYKDSVRNIADTGCFVWNLATLPLAEAMNLTSSSVPAEVSEFELAGLTPAPCRLVDVPRVAESPVAFECRLSQLLQLQGADQQPVDTWMVFGEVVGVHIDPALLQDGVFDTTAAEPILRGGGPADYFTVGPAQRFRMHRPG